uniref:Sodium/calcium exchanger membrane region domain-containing protein n=1 Tax=Oreochromis aureus TaxID=47969 RepID=A0A668VWY2_OREAU
MFICLCLADELFHEAFRVSSLSCSRYLIAQILPPFTVSACVSDFFLPSLAAAIHEFPRDYFTNKQRVEGAVGLHVLCAVYMFYALALVCDDYFVPSLEKICERLHLSEDVAGATFMAAGSSAPELFTSVIGVFITKGDVGVGTIVGSAVFNILCIIGVCGIFAVQVQNKLLIFSQCSTHRHRLHSDLFVDTHDECIRTVFSRWEALTLILMYFVYILIMNRNAKENLIARIPCMCPTANHHRKTSVLMVDELLSAYPHQLSFSEAGMRIMITSHFSPRTRLTMASRMWGIENGLSGAERGVGVRHDDREAVSTQSKCCISLCVSAAGGFNKLKWLLAWPLALLLYFTIPNCSTPRWENWFMLSFVSSTLWIASFSYIMVWMVTVIGFTLGIPDVIMGITFLAAGTSVPDCMASLIVARQGMGDMAVSNSIGSNVFDILVGLGLPWALKTLAINYGSDIKLNSKGLIFSVGLLLASVFMTVLGVHLNNWTLNKRLGFMCLILYSIFLCFSCLIEYNIFTFVNLPTCRDD